MIDRFLRRFSVSRRIIGGFLVLVILLALTIPVIVVSQNLLLTRLQQTTNIEGRANRALLHASVYIQSSRVNLLRYMQDYLPSTQEAQGDIDQASQLLSEAQNYVAADQATEITAILTALAEYKSLIIDMEAMRRQGGIAQASQMLFLASKTGNDLAQKIEQIVAESERRVKAANETINQEAQRRLTFWVISYIGALALSLALALIISRSITRPLNELRGGAELLRAGKLDVAIPTAGADELSVLAGTFNQMASQLAASYLELEQRVEERTRELEKRSNYLQAATQVSQAAASILDTDQLMREVVDLICERFDLYYVGLFMVDETRQWAILRAATGQAGQKMLARGHKIKIGTGMIGWSIANAQARIALEAGEDTLRLATTELPETRSEAAIPLRSRGQVLGALTVQSTQPGAFDPASIAVLQIMADQVAVAIDNARLFAESQAALEAERRAYGELTQAAWAELLRTHAEPGYLCEGDSLRPATGDWRPDMLQAAQTGQAIRTDSRTLAVPIKIREQVLGVIRLDKADEAGEWTSSETALVETLVEQLSAALESARLYQDTQRRAAQEKLIGEVTARMRETLNLDHILRTAALELGRVSGASRVDVRLGTEGEQ